MFSFRIYLCLFVTKHRKNTSKRFKVSCGAPEGLSLSLVEKLQMIWWPSCFLLLHHGHVACCLLSKGRNNAAAFYFPPCSATFILSLHKHCHILLCISQNYCGWLSSQKKHFCWLFVGTSRTAETGFRVVMQIFFLNHQLLLLVRLFCHLHTSDIYSV